MNYNLLLDLTVSWFSCDYSFQQKLQLPRVHCHFCQLFKLTNSQQIMGTSCSNCKRQFMQQQPQNTENSKSLLIDDKQNTRETMKAYWDEHSQKKPSNSLMLLMKEDERFALQEKAEILSYLPNYEGLSVVELGSGVGRFTGDLASKATTVLAVDFVDKFLKENKKRFNTQYPHIDYLCRDVTKLELDNQSYEFVFSNWLMMYLNDEEVYKLAEKFYNWCGVGGYIFFRESCEDDASGDIPPTNNPTFYRNYKTYLKIFDQFDNLERISVNQIKIYMKNKNKTNQYCFLYKKIKN
eukprot:466255_1